MIGVCDELQEERPSSADGGLRCRRIAGLRETQICSRGRRDDQI